MAFHDLVLSLDGEGGWAVYRGTRAGQRDGDANDASYADVAASSSSPADNGASSSRPAADSTHAVLLAREEAMGSPDFGVEHARKCLTSSCPHEHVMFTE